MNSKQRKAKKARARQHVEQQKASVTTAKANAGYGSYLYGTEADVSMSFAGYEPRPGGGWRRRRKMTRPT